MFATKKLIGLLCVVKLTFVCSFPVDKETPNNGMLEEFATADEKFFEGYEIHNRSKRIDRRPRAAPVKTAMTVCYPDGKQCLPDELCKWKKGIVDDIMLCKCIKNTNCEAPYRKRGRHDAVKAICKNAAGRLQCRCFEGYEWKEGQCELKQGKEATEAKETKGTKEVTTTGGRVGYSTGSMRTIGGLPGSVFFAGALFVLLTASAFTVYCFVKRKGGSATKVESPRVESHTYYGSPQPSFTDDGEAETALTGDTDTEKLVKPHKSRSRLSIKKSNKKSKEKEAKKSRSASNTRSKK